MLGLVTLAARAFYILSSIAILTVRLIPVLRTRFLSYGARDQVAHTTRGRQQQQQQQQQQQLSLGIQLVDWASTFKVPHSWFGHFYAVSVATSIACAGLFHDRLDAPNGLCAFLMLVQGCRRLLECLSYSGSGTSRMWIGHYAIGLAFYVVTNIAIWTTGDVPPRDGSDLVGHDGVVWTLGNGRALICLGLFIYCSYKQHQYHRYLASLKKYTLPNEPAFRRIIAPHYTAECGIYLSLALLNVPDHQQKAINGTLLCALIFVAVNLGVTADGTKAWMMEKFPEKRAEIDRRWRMLPPVW